MAKRQILFDYEEEGGFPATKMVPYKRYRSLEQIHLTLRHSPHV